MPLRFEAWTLPSSGTFEKKFDIPEVLTGSGGRELSEFSDETIEVPATWAQLPELVSETAASFIRVFKGSYLVDEFEPLRVNVPAGRPSIRTISGPQRNGLVEGIAILPAGYPEHKEGLFDHIWGGKNLLSNPGFEDGTFNPRIYWLLIDSTVTGGTFTLSDGTDTTAALDWDITDGALEGALEAQITAIDDLSVTPLEGAPRGYRLVITATSGTFTISHGANTTGALAFNISAAALETAIEGLASITNVTVANQTIDGVAGFRINLHTPASAELSIDTTNLIDGAATLTVSNTSKGFAIEMVNPPIIGLTLNAAGLVGGSARLQLIDVGGQLSSGWTRSQQISAGTPREYGTYDVFEPSKDQAHSGDWSLKIDPKAISTFLDVYAGVQQIVRVVPGGLYQASIWVYPTAPGQQYRLVIRGLDEDLISEPLWTGNISPPANTWTRVVLRDIVIPEGDTRVIFRFANINQSGNPATFYVDDAAFNEGMAPDTFTAIVRHLLGLAHDRGTGEFLEVDATDTVDTLNTVLEPISFTAHVGDKRHLGVVLGDGADLGYQWRVVPAADAQIITPAAGTTHVLQIFYIDADEIEDLTAAVGGPSVTVGSDVADAQLVARRASYSTLIGLGTGTVAAETTDAVAEALGRVEQVRDVEHLGTPAAVDSFLGASFAEDVRNRRALTATVLEGARKLPLVHYGEGSKIWWQFPGIVDKEARPVKRVSWTHGPQARFEVGGSRTLTGEAALAKGIDHLLRKPGRRRSQFPHSDLMLGGGTVPTIFVAAANSSAQDRTVAHFVCDGIADQVQFQQAIDALPRPNGNGQRGRIVLAEGNYSVNARTTLPSNDDARIDFVGLGYPTITIDFPTITAGAEVRVFAGLGGIGVFSHFGFHKLRFTGGVAEIRIIDVDGGDLVVDDCIFENLLVQTCVRPPRWLKHSFVVSHCVFRGITISGNEGIGNPNGVIHKGADGGEFNGLIIGNRFHDIVGAIADFGGAAHVKRIVAVGNIVTNSPGTRAGNWTHNIIGSTYTPGDHTGLTQAGIDSTAIHQNVAAEISTITQKTAPVAADLIVIEDSAASNAKKRVQTGNLTEFTKVTALGLTGATAASRYVGATTSGAPGSGTFAKGDFVITQDGNIYVCTTAGSPGTWIAVGASAATDADAIHDNVANEISALTTVTAVTGDWVLIEDASDSFNKKKVDAGDFLGGGGGGGGISRVGRTTAGATWLTPTAGRRYVRQISLNAGQVVASIAVYMRTTLENVAGIYSVALYDDESGPGHVLGIGSGHVGSNAFVFDQNDERWFHAPLGVYVPSTGDYWISWFSAQLANLQMPYDAGGATTGYVTAGGNWWIDKDTTGFGFTSETNDYSMHAIVLG